MTATAVAATSARTNTVRSRFTLRMAVLFVAIAVVGFSTTFFIPVARGQFRAPLVVHAHGALFFAWVLFLLLQTRLVLVRRVALHRRLGWAGAVLAVAMAVSGVFVGAWATRRDVAAGGGAFILGQFVNIIIEMLLFAGLVLAAVAYRRDRESHRRLLLLATISVLGPAWLRFRHLLPMIPNPFVTFSLVADALVFLIVAHDIRTRGRLHPVTLRVGSAMILVHLGELWLLESGPWVRMARAILGGP
jgi:hypothetical protein